MELHIEQGPLLERKEIPIGIVTAIAAPATLRVSIEGAGGHAGGMLMPDRRDAFLAAAEIALAVEAAAKGTKSHRLGGHDRRLQRVPGRGQQRTQPGGAGN